MAKNKNRRRLSGAWAMGPPLQSTPAPQGEGEEQVAIAKRSKTKGGRRKSAGRRISMGGANPFKPLAPAAVKDKDQLQDMFNSILKLSSENRINQKNTWSLGLIDHIDSILTDNGVNGAEGGPAADGDDFAVNFQKASCTLDASVKIYAHRVDDTWSSSFRALENLSRNSSSKEGKGEGDDDDDDADDDDEDGEEGGRKRGRKGGKRSHAATLEKNLSAITLKAVEETCDVDPLFQRMSKTFDEGGARGMLLNNLCSYDSLRIVFDSAEKGYVTTPEHDPELPGEGDETVDVSALAGKLNELCPDLGSLALSSTLEAFHGELDDHACAAGNMSRVSARDISVMMGGADGDDSDSDADGGGEPLLPDLGFEFDDDFAPDEDSASFAAQREHQLEQALDDMGADEENFPVFLPSQPQQQQQQQQQSSGRAPGLALVDVTGTAADEYTFFSQGAATAWDGSKHWKFRKANTFTQADLGDDMLEPAGASASKKRSRKAAMFLDFSAAPEDAKTFAKPSRAAATQLTKAVIQRNLESCGDLLLPPDVHYTAADLPRLFTRPRLLRHTGAARDDDDDDDDLDLDFGAALDHSGFDDSGFDDDVAFNLDDSMGGDGCAYGFASSAPATLFEEDFAMTGLLDPSHKVNKIEVSYCTKAKRVDVRRLKQDLWAEIEARAGRSPEEMAAAEAAASAQVERENSNPASDSEPEEEGEDSDSDFEDSQPRKSRGPLKALNQPTIAGELSFCETMESLAPKLSSDVTVPFYFICLLHLANENGLQLDGEEDLSDFMISQPQVFGH